MKISEAITTIETFLALSRDLFSGSDQLPALEKELGEFPEHLREYIEQIAPNELHARFDLAGAPFILVRVPELIDKLYDFAFEHDLGGSSWVDEWLVVGFQMHDAYCVHRDDEDPKVYKFLFEEEFRNDPVPVADSIGQLMVCAEAIDFTMNHFEDPIVGDGPFSMSLAPEPAKWLFPRMREWAGRYYEEWCGEFDNHSEY